MTTTDKIHQTLRDSAGMRWLVLLLLAFAMFCSYIFMDILSPIKDLMQSTRGWDSTAFGTMQGSETFLNVFVFFLIFAGIILDKMGVRFTAILSGAVMLVGATINWYAVTDAFQGSGLQTWFTNNLNYIPGFDELGISPFYRGMPASAKFAAIGFMIFGCGVEMAGITVSRGIVKWFKGREMALAMGSEMALARLGVATCMIFSPVFAKLGGVIDVSRSVTFGVVLLLIALIMFIVYFFMDRKSLRLKVLIEDLFEISKASSRSVNLNIIEMDIVNLFKQVKLEMEEKITEANLDFRLDIPEEKVIVALDGQKTYRIFENLIGNAVKYAMPHTRVYVKIAAEEGEAVFRMKNVSATELTFNPEEITERFVRGDSARNTEGSGLGLAIVKSFVEIQKGKFWIETEADLFKAEIRWKLVDKKDDIA